MEQAERDPRRLADGWIVHGERLVTEGKVELGALALREVLHVSLLPRSLPILRQIPVLSDTPRTGAVEALKSAMLALDVISGRFCVVLRKEPIFASADPSWPQAVRALPISLAQKRALVGLVGREFANADYCALNGVDRDTSYRELHELVDRGLLVTTGSGAGARYRVVRAAAPSGRPATPLEALETRMSELGYVTNVDYREAFGVGRHAAIAALSAWLADGVLVREGERRSTRYVSLPNIVHGDRDLKPRTT